MPESPINPGFEVQIAAEETQAGSPASTSTQPEAETKTGGPEFVNAGETPIQEAEIKPKEFNAEEFRRKIKKHFKKKPFTRDQVLKLLNLDFSISNKKKASFVLKQMVANRTLNTKQFISIDDDRISHEKPLSVYCADLDVNLAKIDIGRFFEESPTRQDTKREKKPVLPNVKKIKTLESELARAFERIKRALSTKPRNWELNKHAESSSQYNLSDLKVKLNLYEKKFANQVIRQLIKDGILIESEPSEFQKKVHLIELQNKHVRESNMYSINIKAPKIQELIEKE